jgi:hypothetical protein
MHSDSLPSSGLRGGELYRPNSKLWLQTGAQEKHHNLQIFFAVCGCLPIACHGLVFEDEAISTSI